MWIHFQRFMTLQETVSPYMIYLWKRLVKIREFALFLQITQFKSGLFLFSSKVKGLLSFSARQGLNLKQGEWNILQMGNPSYIGRCQLVRFKNIYIESVDSPVKQSIPLMTDGKINVSSSTWR